MDRKTFLKTCGYACLGGVALATLLQSCATSKNVDGELIGKRLAIKRSEFEQVKKGKIVWVHYVMVHHPELTYPICVYRLNATEYTALLMQCTHQGAELQAFGDQLICPAHGSEFNNRGEVQQGPASRSLKTFPLEITGDYIFINDQV